MYLHLNNSKLVIKLKISLENGNAIGFGDSGWPLNALENSLFISMEMDFGWVLVTDPNIKYSYRAVIKNVFNYNKLIADPRLFADG